MTYNRTYDVIIVGGGIAGLAAARELTNLGAKVGLLEARGRLGGQINTTQMHSPHTKKKYPVDLGALYVHGEGTAEDPNPLYSLLKRHHIKPVMVNEHLSDLRDTHGHPESLRELQTRLEPNFNSAIFEIQEAKRIHYKKTLPTVSEVLMYGKDNIPERDSTEYWARKLVTATIMHHTGADLSDLSVIDLMSDRIFEGGDALILGGYTKVVDALYQEAMETGNLKTELRSIVTEIHIHPSHADKARIFDSNNSKIGVITEDGRKFQADAILCSLPLNILKKNKVKFHPDLSSEKLKAFKYIKMGLQNRVLLEFEKPFWPEEVHYLYPNDPNINFWPEYLNLLHFTDSKVPALLASFYAERAQFGKKTDAEIIETAIVPLKRAYPHFVIHPSSWKVSRWDTYTHSLGSGAYCSKGCTVDYLDAIKKEEPGGLFFAGSFTRAKQGQQATVEGAYDSGVEAALDIAAFLKYQSKKGQKRLNVQKTSRF